MKKYALLCLLPVALILASCGHKDLRNDTSADTIPTLSFPSQTATFSVQEDGFVHDYLIANQEDSARIYKADVRKGRTLLVVSKGDYRLYVYELSEKDTSLVASFPICYAINTGQKTKDGDNCTPECDAKHPFRVSEIKDARTWVFDFGDGRGAVQAFGNWFIRLDLSQSFPDNAAVASNRSIGIHGSTNNEFSVPGRDSHGCIRLRDADLEMLHDRYVEEGTRVIIRPLNEDKYPFEVRAAQALGDAYRSPLYGNPLLKRDTKTENSAVVAAAPTAEVKKENSSEGSVKGEKMVTVTGDGVRLRYEPNTHCKVYTEVSTGTQLSYISKADNWYKIRYEGHELYISADYAELK